MRLDLHVHTTASDGAWSASQVVEGAARGGLDVIALADHDTTAAVGAARNAGSAARVQVVPAIEVSSTHRGRDIHVLGYFVDPESDALLAHRSRATQVRAERMETMIQRLREQGIEVAFEEVEEAAGPDRGSLGRPHLAKVLVAHGHASSVPNAFDRLIGDDLPAFVPTELLSPHAAVELVLEGGGVPVWAHPPADLLDGLLPSLLGAGLRGLEVYRPTHRPADILRLEGICRSRGLLASGGSDWHTPDSGTSLGDFFVTADEIEGLLAVGGL